MYLLDWKIPKRLYGVRDDVVRMYLGQEGLEVSGKHMPLLTRAISCFIYNASYHVARGFTEFEITLNEVSYSQPLVYNGNKVRRRVSYTWTRRMLDWMVVNNIIELDIGSVETFKVVGGRVAPDKVRKSLVRLSEGFVEHLMPVSSVEQQEILKSVLELRGEEGEAMTFRKYLQQEKLISLLNTYNMIANDSDITVDSKEFYVQLKKVFNKDFDHGGRSYLVGAAITTELLKKTNRGKILIGGEKTVEVDYSYLHAAMIAELEGYTFEEGFDPYAIQMEGYDNDCLRKIGKLAMLILINSSSNRQAAQALSFEMFNKLPLQEWKDKGLVPNPVESKRVIDCIYEHNQYAKHWFGCQRGLELQNLDSKVMDVILDYWNQKGVIVLPIHDSVIIQEKYLEEAKEVMYNAYEAVLKSKINCKVEER